MILGGDVSEFQGDLTQAHWHAMASALRFVYIRCGYGNGSADKHATYNIHAARDAGIVVGAYHVGFPLRVVPGKEDRDPNVQCERHFSACGGLGSNGGTLPPALDLEWPIPGSADWEQYYCSTKQVRAWALAYLRRASVLYGRTPVIYTFPDYWARITTGAPADEMAEFATFPLWWADYRPGAPMVRAPWTLATLWQMSDGGGKLPNGCKYDENAWIGSDAEWLDFILSKPAE